MSIMRKYGLRQCKCLHQVRSPDHPENKMQRLRYGICKQFSILSELRLSFSIRSANLSSGTESGLCHRNAWPAQHSTPTLHEQRTTCAAFFDV